MNIIEAQDELHRLESLRNQLEGKRELSRLPNRSFSKEENDQLMKVTNKCHSLATAIRIAKETTAVNWR